MSNECPHHCITWKERRLPLLFTLHYSFIDLKRLIVLSHKSFVHYCLLSKIYAPRFCGNTWIVFTKHSTLQRWLGKLSVSQEEWKIASREGVFAHLPPISWALRRGFKNLFFLVHLVTNIWQHTWLHRTPFAVSVPPLFWLLDTQMVVTQMLMPLL